MEGYGNIFIFVRLLALMGFLCMRMWTEAVWLCDKFQFIILLDNVTAYECDPNSTATIFLGLYINRGMDNVTKPLSKAKFGVEVLKPHNVNSAALNSSLPDSWRDIDSFGDFAEYEPHVAIRRNITLYPGDIAPIFQKRTTCGYKSDNWDVDNAVTVYSRQFEPYSDRASANDDICLYRSSGDKIQANFDDKVLNVINNNGTTERLVSVSYEEGVSFFPGPDMYEDEGQGDDRLELVKWMNSKIEGLGSAPSLAGGGLDWGKKYKPFKEFGLKVKQANFSAPPNRTTKFYGAYAWCPGNFYVKSWIFPVFFPLLVPEEPGSYSGECESPDIQPLCVYKDWRVETLDAALLRAIGGCADSIEDVEIPRFATHLKVEYGIKGPYADRLSVDFKNKFLKGLQKIRGTTEYNWANFNVTNWEEYEGSNKSQEVPKLTDGVTHLRAFQIQARCDLYTMLTKYIVFVHMIGWKRKCVKVTGNVPSGLTCEIMMKKTWLYL